MTVAPQLESYVCDIESIVADVFSTMLGVTARACLDPWTPSTDHLTAAVHFAGDWRGALMVESARSTSRRLTHRLMGIDPADQTNDDVLDAMGELANMIGGNLKSVLPRGIGLSMPSVVEGSDYSVRLCGGNLAARRAFQSPLGLVWVTIIEMVPRRT